MNSHQADRLLQEIDRAILEIQKFQPTTKQKSYYAQFLVVYINGVYEECIETIITEWCKAHASLEVFNFVDLMVSESFRNPHTQNIIELLNKFNAKWGDEILKLPNIHKSALDSIVNDKNNLAHKAYSTLTLDDIIDFFKRSRRIIEKIDELLLG